ncbi:hypothetical protein SPRG_20010 [Saprolegnia parasitica CBS 223.65]|uniref:Signal recognition particle 14 kDa protein n=1 Tax=Saprolegnia parasitica (strain CBS 223.65) TaxID=695850 RepID=A0A067CPR6_SAPPC|nr:hypothetical protein SPRG_20010 [Saprolegnia parasitica CBS 223.65]KDO28802.1 hypothetical protein SPRG_20010 [Saprolegnia parasitica CBS 223.65]|eukprot:XP_012200538.1 hypothetical protein SPRG_20010 [Saprolegnia parasitica CBS 223.65]
MVLVSSTAFLPQLASLFQTSLPGGSGAVTVRTKSVASTKVGKQLRADAVAAGPSVYLVRAYKNGNNKHKAKLSTIVPPASHAAFQAELTKVMKAKMQGLKKPKRHASQH